MAASATDNSISRYAASPYPKQCNSCCMQPLEFGAHRILQGRTVNSFLLVFLVSGAHGPFKQSLDIARACKHVFLGAASDAHSSNPPRQAVVPHRWSTAQNFSRSPLAPVLDILELSVEVFSIYCYFVQGLGWWLLAALVEIVRHGHLNISHPNKGISKIGQVPLKPPS